MELVKLSIYLLVLLLTMPLQARSRARSRQELRWRPGLKRKVRLTRTSFECRSDGRMHICIGCVTVSQDSKTYILRSTLEAALIESAAVTKKRIFKVEAANTGRH